MTDKQARLAELHKALASMVNPSEQHHFKLLSRRVHELYKNDQQNMIKCGVNDCTQTFYTKTELKLHKLSSHVY